MHQNAPNELFLFQNFPGDTPLQNIFSFFNRNPLPCLIDVEDRSHETVLWRVCSHNKYIDPSEIPYPEWDMSEVAWDDDTDDDDSLLEDLSSLSGDDLDQSPDDVHSSSMEDFEPGAEIQALGMAVENESRPSTNPTTLIEEAS